MFSGFPDDALRFYEGLEADNSKAYWSEHRSVYERAVRAPMLALVAELDPDGTLFRPYRDVRFSADKTPYKTHQGARFADCYVQLSAEGLAAGAGLWEMAPDQLARYREAVADDVLGAALERAVASVTAAGHQVLSRETLATAPRGYPRDHPRVELLRRKGLATWASWQPEPWLESREVLARLTPFFDASRPVREWLAAIGPSTLPRTRR